MTTSLADRTWTACFSALQFDRLLTGELDHADAERLGAHAAACARCAATVAELRSASEERLPPLRLVRLPARTPFPVRAAAAVVGLAAAAASLLLVIRSPGTRMKGAGFTLGMYVEHAGDVRRVGPGETIAAGDAVRFTVTAPRDVYVAVLSLDPRGKASVYFPAASRADLVRAGTDVALPLATRLDDTVGEERILGLFCSSAVELEPLRLRLDSGDPAIPDDCQVTRWSFVKR